MNTKIQVRTAGAQRKGGGDGCSDLGWWVRSAILWVSSAAFSFTAFQQSWRTAEGDDWPHFTVGETEFQTGSPACPKPHKFPGPFFSPTVVWLRGDLSRWMEGGRMPHRKSKHGVQLGRVWYAGTLRGLAKGQ